MRPFWKNLIDNLTILSASLIFAIMAIAISNPISFKTVDDTQILYDLLRNQKSSVLGVSNQNSPCPQDKPIIGWIDFQGKKIITENLPGGQLPGACFQTLEEASAEGFTLED